MSPHDQGADDQASALAADSNHIALATAETPRKSNLRQSSLTIIEPSRAHRLQLLKQEAGANAGSPRPGSSSTASPTLTRHSSIASSRSTYSESPIDEEVKTSFPGENDDDDNDESEEGDKQDANTATPDSEPSWTPEMEERLVFVQAELEKAQKRWSPSQELWIKEADKLLEQRRQHRKQLKKKRQQEQLQMKAQGEQDSFRLKRSLATLRRRTWSSFRRNSRDVPDGSAVGELQEGDGFGNEDEDGDLLTYSLRGDEPAQEDGRLSPPISPTEPLTALSPTSASGSLANPRRSNTTPATTPEITAAAAGQAPRRFWSFRRFSSPSINTIQRRRSSARMPPTQTELPTSTAATVVEPASPMSGV